MMVFVALGIVTSAVDAQVPDAMHRAADGGGNAARPFDAVQHLRDVERRLAEAPDDLRLHSERLGTLYLLAVELEDAVEAAYTAIDTIRTRFDADAGSALDARLVAYDGALTTLRAKHAFWPHHKLGHVRRGMSILDRAISLEAEDAVIRYLRLMSGFYLPGLFGRHDEVREDLAVLARLLPAARVDFPGRMFHTVVRFVLDNGRVTAADRRVLEHMLRQE
jgi:hypothetical protein